VSIRAARRDDFEAVTRLLEELGRPPTAGERSEADCRVIYEEQIVEPNTHHIVAEHGGEVVAFCSLHFRQRLNWPTQEAWIPDLIVAPSARRAGIGRELHEEAERRAREHGCHALTLESGYQRAEAHHMYRVFHMRDAGKQFVKELH
jgi:GNAT superfamily N-acetyltransferase